MNGQFVFGLNRKLIYGHGVNDAKYVTQPHSSTDKWRCPYYEKWKLMLERCYSSKYQDRRPSYIGCEVCDDWKFFSSFREWMSSQAWVGRHLDKDLIGTGKLYSPDDCVFLRPEVNNFLTDSAASRGSLPIGVIAHANGKFRSRIRVSGRLKNLGIYRTSDVLRGKCKWCGYRNIKH